MLKILKQAAALALTSLLALTGPAAHAQAAPAAEIKLVPDHYYLNGQPSTKAAVEALDPKKDIASINVLQGQQAIDYTHDPHAKGAVLVTTKAAK